MAATVGVGALLLSAPSFAQSLLQQAPKSPFYLQLGAGQSWQDSPANTGNPGINLSGNGTATAAKVTGGLQITPMWGAELSYFNLGKVGITTPGGVANYETNVTTAAATLSYPLTQSLTLTGRVWVGYSHLQLDVPSQNYAGSSVKYPLVGGLGLRYNLTPRLALTLDYDYLGGTGRFDGGDSTTGQVLSAGLLLRY
ncbi:MAG: outer membrane beta-barrel protein [Rhodoferax sp.]